MSGILAHLPEHLLDILRNQPPPRVPYAHRFSAALLFADISGFTALTERLQTRGREGAELVARVISSAFRPAIRAVEANGGSIAAFGGDALFCIFPGPASVARAAAAAAAIQRAMARTFHVRAIGPIRLQIKQALHHGTVSAVHLGRATVRHHLVTGPPVLALARLEKQARDGEVLLSREARQRRGAGAPRRAPERARRKAPPEAAAYVHPAIVELLPDFDGAFRKVTVLFLESRGTGLAALQRVFLAIDATLGRYGGILLESDLSTSGVKWMCVFGIPDALESDGERAAMAALEIVAQLAPGIAVRGGLHAGIVANLVAGTATRRSFGIAGDAVNTAARIGGAAAWGEVLVAKETKDAWPALQTRSRGSHALKGKRAAVTLHALRAVPPARTTEIRVTAPLVGREPELAALIGHLARAAAGEGTTVAIEGEAGLGKSRLRWEAAKEAGKRGFAVHVGQCVAFGDRGAHAVAALVRSLAGIPPEAAEAATWRRLSREVARCGLRPGDAALLARYLGIRPQQDAPSFPGQETLVNQRAALGSLLEARGRERPLLLVLEDMHWADEGTRALAAWLAPRIASSPVALLLVHRAGYDPPAGTQVVALRELGERGVSDLLEAHIGRVSPAVRELVTSRAGGNPFYVEELARHLLESGALVRRPQGSELVREPGPEELPASVESLIAARLASLSATARRVAQHGAVIGRTFSRRILETVLADAPHASHDDAARGLAELVAHEIVFTRKEASAPEADLHVFKHALTRDVAYASILTRRRRHLHRTVAAALDRSEGPRDPAVLGYHREEAGQPAAARACYRNAARAARERRAADDAIALLGRYLALVTRPSRASVAARVERGALLVERGRLRDAERELRRARREALAAGSAPLESAALRTLGGACRVTGRMDEARRHLSGALRLSTRGRDMRGEVEARESMGSLLIDLGRSLEARAVLEPALERVRALGDGALEGRILRALAATYVARGQSDEATAIADRALALHRRHGDRRSEGITTGHLGNLNADLGRVAEAEQLYLRALQLAREVGDRRFEGNWLGVLGVLCTETGRMPEAREKFELAMQIARQTDDRRLEAVWAMNLANTTDDGDDDASAALIEKALAIQREVGDRKSVASALGNLAMLDVVAARFDEARTRIEEAIRITDDIGDVAPASSWRAILGSIDLFTQELPARALEEVVAAEERLAPIAGGPYLALILCVRVHAELAAGRPARATLERVRAIGKAMGTGGSSFIATRIGVATRAVAAAAAGRPLVAGIAPSDLTGAQLAWLRLHRPAALPVDAPAVSGMAARPPG